ncbi:hypothetical protein [Roseateles sp. LKC17W]|uniref:TonB C-terminal domain-containing protein n=1 Tax=Pelomonas margarita TaxID=3299031 RepID=A0ABW7FKT0_9BURK
MRMKTAAAVGMAAWLCCLAPAQAADKPAAGARAVLKPAAKPAARPAAKPVANEVAAAAAPASAVPPAPTLPDWAPAEMNRVLKNNVAPRFTVLASDELDARTRAAAEAMQAEHLPRVRALMERWFLEELAQPHPQRAFARMLARLANEFALWGRDSLGPEQDAVLAQMLQQPGMCRPVGPNASELVMRLARLRGLPAEMREAAVQAEALLLARWGQPRQVSDAEPLAAEEALLQLRATGQAPATPLPPVLAFFYLGDQDNFRRDPFIADPPSRCAMHQWAGASPAQFRAAMALQAADFVWQERRKAAAKTSDDDPYPSLSTFFGARGVFTVQADVNAEGRVVRARIIKRDVEVPGIRGVRPFAHEGTLELATLAKAREVDWSATATKHGSLKAVEREFHWSLSWR